MYPPSSPFDTTTHAPPHKPQFAVEIANQKNTAFFQKTPLCLPYPYPLLPITIHMAYIHTP